MKAGEAGPAPTVTVSGEDDPDLRRLLLRELAPLMHPGTAPRAPLWICAAVRDAKSVPRGGLIGLTAGAWLSIDLLWLPADLRGRGLGTALLGEAEQRARAEGCAGAYVGTTSADARRFYERNGYEAKLVLADLYPGVTQITLQKDFRGRD